MTACRIRMTRRDMANDCMRAHAWRKCYHGSVVRAKKTQECTHTRRGTGWRGRVNAVRPCHVATTYASPCVKHHRLGEVEKRTDWRREEQRESSRIGICDPDCLRAKSNPSRASSANSWHSTKFNRSDCARIKQMSRTDMRTEMLNCSFAQQSPNLLYSFNNNIYLYHRIFVLSTITKLLD